MVPNESWSLAMKQWLILAVGGPCLALVAGFLLTMTTVTTNSYEQQKQGGDGDGDGWRLEHDVALDLQKDRCTIPRIMESEMTTGRFVNEFWRRTPFILQRVQGTNTLAQQWTTKQHLRNKFAQKLIPLAALEAYSFRGERSGHFGTYLDSLQTTTTAAAAATTTATTVDAHTKGNETPFAFGVDQFGVGDHYVVPAVLTENSNLEWHFQVAVAASGAGLPFHWHADVFAEVLHGERRWLLYPPHRSPIFNPRASSARWLKDVYTKKQQLQQQQSTNNDDDDDGLLECTLLPDETIYVPADWFHSTLSLGEAVSITTSFAAQYRRERYQLTNGPSDHAHMLDALERRDLKTALHHAEQLQLHRPQNFVPYSWLGVIQTLQARTFATDHKVRTALESARSSTETCIALNPLYAPCHVWLHRQLMALSMIAMETNQEVAVEYERLAIQAKQTASELSFAEDDEILDPRWQPKTMKKRQSK